MTELDRLRRLAGFSYRDLAAWIGAPDGAVRTWCLGSKPADHKRVQVDVAKRRLIQELASGTALPVPLWVKLKDRRAYVLKLRNGSAGGSP